MVASNRKRCWKLAEKMWGGSQKQWKKLEKAQEGQERGRFWGSREQEGVEYLKCLTYGMYQGQPSRIPGSFRTRAPFLLEKVVEGEGTLSDSCSKTTWNGGEIGVLRQIPLAGQTNMHFHFLPFCLLPLSRLKKKAN